MDNTQKEKFESLWSNFIALVKGKLITMSNKHDLITPLANLILADAASSWLSVYEINGKWLSDFIQENPQKGELVKEILSKDMKFVDIKITHPISKYYDYVIPAVGAVLGYAVSAHFNLSRIYQAVSTLAPAALLYPAVNRLRSEQSEKITDDTIQIYIAQLNKYKDSIISVLSED